MYGMGESSPIEVESYQKHRMGIYTATIEDWRKQLGLDNFYVLGYSIGSYIALNWIKHSRPNIRGIYLIQFPGEKALKYSIESEKNSGFHNYCLITQLMVESGYVRGDVSPNKIIKKIGMNYTFDVNIMNQTDDIKNWLMNSTYY